MSPCRDIRISRRLLTIFQLTIVSLELKPVLELEGARYSKLLDTLAPVPPRYPSELVGGRILVGGKEALTLL